MLFAKHIAPSIALSHLAPCPRKNPIPIHSQQHGDISKFLPRKIRWLEFSDLYFLSAFSSALLVTHRIISQNLQTILPIESLLPSHGLTFNYPNFSLTQPIPDTILKIAIIILLVSISNIYHKGTEEGLQSPLLLTALLAFWAAIWKFGVEAAAIRLVLLPWVILLALLGSRIHARCVGRCGGRV